MSRHDLVVLSLEPWDGVWRRNQYLVAGLLEADAGLRVTFVEPARDVVYDAVSGRRPGLGAGLRPVAGHGSRLLLLQPTKWLPRRAGPFADRLLHAAVRRGLRRVGLRRPVLWVNDPGWAWAAAATRAPTVYDMTDDWAVAHRTDREHDRVAAGDRLLLRTATAVVACSAAIASSRRDERPDMVVIPNAVDVARYRAPAPRPADLPHGPVALYVGTLHEDRLDVGLVVRTGAQARRHGATVVLVGPDALSARNSSLLRASPGVRVLGARAHTLIPGYLQHADALIVPHVVDAFTDSLDPIKLYEYRAVGRPIVSTPVAGFRELSGVAGVFVVPDTVFPQQVIASFAEPAMRPVPADVPDWSDRVEDFGRVLAPLWG